MTKPRITVYVASRNYGRFLADAIESVLRQTVNDWELIVIDDGSTDETSDVINLYRGHPNISAFRTEGIGLAGVCNLALSHARGRYLIRLDGDDVLDENILLVLGNMLDREPELALVFPGYYLVDAFGEIFAQERRKRLYAANHMLDLPPSGACTLIRASVLREVGGYREDVGAQDGLDLWTKVAARYKCANVDLPLFYYRRHGTNLTMDSQRIIDARRQIKRDAVKDRVAASGPIIAVIPCRRNFDFVDDLWKQKLGDKTLLERDIDVCLRSTLFDRIVVTCDNDEAGALVGKYDDPRLEFFLRDPQSTIRSESIVPTLEKIAQKFDPNFKGTIVMRYAQSPFVTIDTLEEAVTSLAMSDADASTGVEEIDQTVFRRTRYGLEALNNRGELRSDFDVIYRDVRTCIATRSRNLKKGSLLGNNIVSFIVSAAECFVIDSDHKLRIARLMSGDLR
jgi:glycosyltransferase involved in cell wall biosynthesis